ncbi:pyridoxamine 5'-phosphate oxidase family protein [Microbacterium sp. zg.Y1090]|uniref:pyridoxamine 5'-phosphate oxidase family protein n=1 Tax=Microbacterium TaxID=33882 RepID=UPI00214BA857|nr:MULTISPECIES: pyridoxamine 5'-phosphate oxidase family protein [unclassified Microbacterium]MCR2812610.1 pyridoxamine 5'-phosphate oxidase family protein [Microbacterium sp. zg.Y1084]MCR2817594.1 pyridoxamine 5'-phosphate oxidase family protein [Microbacterium sp. zg.Y1090]MDL5485763.1 pyridoxamine 5'-phosphate oxidase family protein [Microbacterium sp. zg-Y1211]WIM28929.1 pyridoxamine 5'-phosphate oxidase family protein [Microbacterium sp. zg-Y1090]
MDQLQEYVASLSDDECWERLETQKLGRLVTHVGGVLDIFPVNFVVDEKSLVFRTAPGSKLFELTVSDEVLFEVDDHTDDDAWSVVVRGHAHVLDTYDQVAAADKLPLHPWIPTLKYHYVRIAPTSLSGRAFVRAEEPDRYGAAEY